MIDMKEENVLSPDLTYKNQWCKIYIPCDWETEMYKNMGRKRKATLRKDGRYQCNAKLGSEYKACYGKSEYEAISKANELEYQYEQSCNSKEPAIKKKCKSKYAFINCFYRYRNYRLLMEVVQPQTVDREENTFNKYFLESVLTNVDIRKLTTKDVYTFFMGIIKEHEAITNREWQRIKHIIKAVIDFVYDEEFDFSNNAPVIDWDKVKRKIPKGKIYSVKKREYAVPKSDQAKLYESMVEHKYPINYASVLCILLNFSLGLRIGELAALTVDDIDWERKVVLVSRTVKKCRKRNQSGDCIPGSLYKEGSPKTRNGIREIPLTQKAQDILNILMDYRKQKGYQNKYLCYDGSDVIGKTECLRRTLAVMCDKSKVDGFNTHRIRKSFASELNSMPDIELAQIAEYLGHSEISTTLNNYILASKESIEEQRRKMQQVV